MTSTLAKRRPKTHKFQIRLEERHWEILERLARQRGCDASALAREATIAYFKLPIDENTTFVTKGTDTTGEVV